MVFGSDLAGECDPATFVYAGHGCAQVAVEYFAPEKSKAT
jgi:hypothetical protein